MQVGDLVKTHNGNLVLITEIGDNGGGDWCNILFVETGYHRTGFPTVWLRRLK
jgi:hypothetical protein